MATATDADHAAFFLERYRAMDTDEIVQLKTGGLSDVAQAAADLVLKERGVTPDVEAQVIRQLETPEVPARWASGRPATSGPFLRFPLRALLGLEPLWKVYWIAGWLGSVVAFVLSLAIGVVVQAVSMRLGGIVSALLMAAFIAWWCIAVWRCAYNVRPGRDILGSFARAVAVLHAGSVVYLVIGALRGG